MAENPVAQAIIAQAPNRDTALAMLMGSYLESNQTTNERTWDVNAYSAGPFMIHEQPGNVYYGRVGGTTAGAENPAKATAAMLGAGTTTGYAYSTSQVPASLWASNPELAGEEAAYGAEHPSETYYQSQGVARVNAAYKVAASELAGAKSAKTSTASSATHPNAHTGKAKTASDLTAPGSSSGSAGASSAKKPSTTPSTQSTNPLTSWVQSLEKAKPFPTLGWSWLPWNWGEDAMNSVWADIVTWGLILGGIVIALYGLKVTMGHGGGGGGGSNITVQPTIERDVEHAGEDAAVAAPLAAA